MAVKIFQRLKRYEERFWRDSIMGTLDILYYAFKIIGLAPFSRKLNTSKRYEYFESKLNFSNFLFLMGVPLLSSYLLGWNYKKQIQTDKFSFMSTILFFFSVSNAAACSAVPFVFFFRQKDFLDSFYLVRDTDRLFRKLGRTFTYVNYHRLTSFLLIFMCVSCILIYEIVVESLSDVTFREQFPETIIYCGSYVLRQAPLYLYFSFVVLVISKFRSLNRIVSHWNPKHMDEGELRDKLETVIEIYERVCEFQSKICSCCDLTTVFNIISTSLIMLLCVEYFFVKDEKRGLEIATWALVNVPFTWGNIAFTHYAAHVSQKTVETLAGLEIPFEKQEINLQRSNILLEIYHKRIEYTPMGLFTLNIKLVAQHIDTMANIIMFLLELNKQQSTNQD